jgi:integrase
MWPVVRYGEKRAITLEEHRRVLAVTPTLERRQYYEVLWETGAAQTDIAKLTADRIDWENGTILFHRTKQEGKAGDVFLVMGPTLEDIILTLPSTGLLFPGLAKVGENDRSTAFAIHCKKASIEGVTLHSYRYAVIQRAKACGYNKRHAMAMVGQTREQTHDQYAKGGATTVPSLEEYELAYRSAQEDRLKAREEKRKNIINLRNHLDAQDAAHRQIGAA